MTLQRESDDGPSESGKLKGWGFSAQTLINFARTMIDDEKDALIDALWPALKRRLDTEAQARRARFYVDENGNPL